MTCSSGMAHPSPHTALNVASASPALTVARSPSYADRLTGGMVQQHLATFLAHLEGNDQAGRLPAFVRRELEAYLACGLLADGCVQCERCGDDMVVAFSCKGRGFCPSCGGRRMTELARASLPPSASRHQRDARLDVRSSNVTRLQRLALNRPPPSLPASTSPTKNA
jgi:hypothetical protein